MTGKWSAPSFTHVAYVELTNQLGQAQTTRSVLGGTSVDIDPPCLWHWSYAFVLVYRHHLWQVEASPLANECVADLQPGPLKDARIPMMILTPS